MELVSSTGVRLTRLAKSQSLNAGVHTINPASRSDGTGPSLSAPGITGQEIIDQALGDTKIRGQQTRDCLR